MQGLPRRKNLRLKSHDYSQTGCYFITICAYAQQTIFGRIPVGAIHESPATALPIMYQSPEGDIVEQVLLEIPNRYPAVEIDKHVIMPNHIHLLINVNEVLQNKERAIHESPLQRVERSLVSKVVGYLKMNASKKIRVQNNKINNVWQRSYHDHIIRNEAEYLKIWQYIAENPAKWADDCYYAK